ncbi:MAG: DNA repair protein RecO [Planctomycetia bacterium]|nr:DNA repair protein RecO [Planctomycetia bacterium]
MPIEHSDALVVRSVEYSESSLILTLFTREYGKIHGIAKGGRRLKNPFETSLDILTHIYVSFLKKNSDALDILTEAKLIRRFRPNRSNYSGLNAGYYLIELLNEMTDDYDPMPELFDLAEETLIRFQTGLQIHKFLIHFECGLLELCGQFPSTRFCVECGKPLFDKKTDWEKSTNCSDCFENEANRQTFSFLEGGVICPQCRYSQNYMNIASVSSGTLNLLEFMKKTDFIQVDALDFAVVSASIWGEVRGVLNHYISHTLGKKLKMTEHFDLILPFDRF